MKNILNSICSFYNIKQSHIFENNRKGSVIFYRHILIYMIYTLEKGTTLHDIIEYLNWNGCTIKEHATILNAIKSIRNKLYYDKKIRLEIDALKQYIEENQDYSDVLLITKVNLVNGILR